jgi:hypothetical protein
VGVLSVLPPFEWSRGVFSWPLQSQSQSSLPRLRYQPRPHHACQLLDLTCSTQRCAHGSSSLAGGNYRLVSRIEPAVYCFVTKSLSHICRTYLAPQWVFILCNFQFPPRIHHCSFLFSIRRSAQVIYQAFIIQFIPVAGIKLFLCGLSCCETGHHTAQIQGNDQLIIHILSLDCDGMR